MLCTGKALQQPTKPESVLCNSDTSSTRKLQASLSFARTQLLFSEVFSCQLFTNSLPGVAVKVLLGKPTSHIRVPQVRLSPAQLLAQTNPGKQQFMAQVLG